MFIPKLTNENFNFIANRFYNDVAADVDEFKEDMKRFRYIKRLLNNYRKTGEIKHRLLLNHVIILTNVFDDMALELLLFKIPEFEREIIACLVFLNRIKTTDKRLQLCDEIILDRLKKDRFDD